MDMGFLNGLYRFYQNNPLPPHVHGIEKREGEIVIEFESPFLVGSSTSGGEIEMMGLAIRILDPLTIYCTSDSPHTCGCGDCYLPCEYPHPNANRNGRLCIGSAEPIMNETIRKKIYPLYLHAIYKVLRAGENGYVHLGYWN